MIVLEQAFDDALDIVLDGAALKSAVNECATDPVAAQESAVGLLVVHDVGFKKEDRALVEAIGEQIAGINIRAASDGQGVRGGVSVRRQTGAGGEALGEGFGKGHLLLPDAGEEALKHFKAGILVGQFGGRVATIDEQMEVVDGRVLRGGGVSPGFGIEVETEDEVGLDLLIDKNSTGMDFGNPIKKLFTLPLKSEQSGLTLNAGIAVGRRGEA